MFQAKFISAREGVSQKGTQWYMLELIACTINNGTKVLKAFCTENAFKAAESLSSFETCRCIVGVDEKGNLKVANIRPEKEKE